MDRIAKRKLTAATVCGAGFLLLLSSVAVDFVLGYRTIVPYLALLGVVAMTIGIIDYKTVVRRMNHRRRIVRE